MTQRCSIGLGGAGRVLHKSKAPIKNHGCVLWRHTLETLCIAPPSIAPCPFEPGPDQDCRNNSNKCSKQRLSRLKTFLAVGKKAAGTEVQQNGEVQAARLRARQLLTAKPEDGSWTPRHPHRVPTW